MEDRVPTYSYACTSCDNAFDIVQSMSEDSLTQCPDCQGRLRKLYNNVGVVFKGSGFYRTDSRSGSSSTGGSAPSTSASSDSGSSGASSAGTSTPSGSSSAGSSSATTTS